MSATALGLLALLVVAGAATLWFRAARDVRLPTNRTGFVLAWAAGALLGLLAFVQGPGWVGGVPAFLAVLAGGFLLFTVAISRQQAAPDAVTVGSRLPDFVAPDENGERFELSSTRGRPLLLKFFRGHW